MALTAKKYRFSVGFHYEHIIFFKTPKNLCIVVYHLTEEEDDPEIRIFDQFSS
jgi:hypothetical protein